MSRARGERAPRSSAPSASLLRRAARSRVGLFFGGTRLGPVVCTCGGSSDSPDARPDWHLKDLDGGGLTAVSPPSSAPAPWLAGSGGGGGLASFIRVDECWECVSQWSVALGRAQFGLFGWRKSVPLAFTVLVFVLLVFLVVVVGIVHQTHQPALCGDRCGGRAARP